MDFGEKEDLKSCRVCPRECGADRLAGELGWCRTGAGFPVASLGPHLGEEPVISGTHGICNIFFSHCNLQCIFCQNYQISRNTCPGGEEGMDPGRLVGRIIHCLEQGCHAVGFVSPSHVVPQVRMLIKALRSAGADCVFVYNSNGYDRVETLRGLEGLIDVYLPDLKYMDAGLAQQVSGAGDYPAVAGAAILEMYRQKGATLITDGEGRALRGLIIRHLVLPGHAEQSVRVLEWIAGHVSTGVHISLMSQYYPASQARNLPPFDRQVTAEEYGRVVEAMERLGFYRGWVQDLDSASHYRPDFDREQPFMAGEPF